ncbi:MAG TPA: hypothetical protein VMF29_03835 [Candidatus Edwardsbacteria bacterium]|nr:hypothetical protein [Candidatus Edwardsbacteria bacterium]
MKRIAIAAALLLGAALSHAQTDSSSSAQPCSSSCQREDKTVRCQPLDRAPQWAIGLRTYYISGFPGALVIERLWGNKGFELNASGQLSSSPSGDSKKNGWGNIRAATVGKVRRPLHRRVGWIYGIGPTVEYDWSFDHYTWNQDSTYNETARRELSVGLTTYAGLFLDGQRWGRNFRLELGVAPVSAALRYNWERTQTKSWVWNTTTYSYHDVVETEKNISRGYNVNGTINGSVSLSLSLLR